MKPALTIRKSKKVQGGSVYYICKTPGESGYIHLDKIAQYMREREVIFDGLDQDEQDKIMLAILARFETCNDGNGPDWKLRGDIKQLNRIIRNDGFCEYIKRLEANL